MSLINTTKTEFAGIVPLSTVLLRVKKEPTFHLSARSGGKSLVFVFEVAEPSTVQDKAGNEIAIGGLELSQYIPVEGKGLFRFVEFHQALRDNSNDVPVEIELDDQSGLPVGITYTGMSFYANVKSQVQELKNGDQAMLNPLTGKAQTTSRLELIKFITS